MGLRQALLHSFGHVHGRDDYGGQVDYCYEKKWATFAFVCATLWIGVTSCILFFIKSGNHAKWEQKHSSTSTADVEIAGEAQVSLEVPTVNTAVAMVSEEPTKVDDRV